MTHTPRYLKINFTIIWLFQHHTISNNSRIVIIFSGPRTCYVFLEETTTKSIIPKTFVLFYCNHSHLSHIRYKRCNMGNLLFHGQDFTHINDMNIHHFPCKKSPARYYRMTNKLYVLLYPCKIPLTSLTAITIIPRILLFQIKRASYFNLPTRGEMDRVAD